MNKARYLNLALQLNMSIKEAMLEPMTTVLDILDLRNKENSKKGAL